MPAITKAEKRVARYVAFLFAHVLSPDVEGSRERKLSALRRLAEWLSSSASSCSRWTVAFHDPIASSWSRAC